MRDSSIVARPPSRRSIRSFPRAESYDGLQQLLAPSPAVSLKQPSDLVFDFGKLRLAAIGIGDDAATPDVDA